MLITKGDWFDQEAKIARSGLGDDFNHIEVVSEKNAETYQKIMARHGITTQRFLMVGNSLKSDILPSSRCVDARFIFPAERCGLMKA